MVQATHPPCGLFARASNFTAGCAPLVWQDSSCILPRCVCVFCLFDGSLLAGPMRVRILWFVLVVVFQFEIGTMLIESHGSRARILSTCAICISDKLCVQIHDQFIINIARDREYYWY